MSELHYRTATELAGLIRRKELSAREVLEAHIERIEATNPAVNAIVTETLDLARETAAEADERLAAGADVGPLHGLPVAHKDLHLTNGIRTTMGSPIYADWVPSESSLIVERLQAAGAITVGKTNTPEFGAGSHTFNQVFGRTHNPYDLTRTCGGSSGGAAVALACGMVPIADGSDMGGSLRNPASFNNVVGFRPPPGRVPTAPPKDLWGVLGVEGPMARTVTDVALQLTVMAGPTPRAPTSIEQDPAMFAESLDCDVSELRIALSPHIGDLPVDPEVVAVVETAGRTFESLGAKVTLADPPLDDADEVFDILRAHTFEQGFGALLEKDRERIKETVVWNVERGQRLSAPDVTRANRLRTTLYGRWLEFLGDYDIVLAPVSQVPPFPIEIEYPTEIDGQQMESYIAWMKSCYRFTVTAAPALSVPGGFTPGGLPVGVQLVGGHHDDLGVLRAGYAFEQATNYADRHPDL